MASTTPLLFFILSLLSLLSLTFFYLHSTTTSSNTENALLTQENSIKVYISPLPRSLNYGLLESYWALTSDTRIGGEVDNEIRKTLLPKLSEQSLPYPENPIIKQYSAEYWILGDLSAPEELKRRSFARRVSDSEEADVVFVPFFATLSAELQLVIRKSVFRKRVGENEDYARQRMVVDLVKKTEAWTKSGGRDHVFVVTDPVAMWHVKDEIAPAILLVVDFGGWYSLDSKTSNDNSSDLMIHHTQVSLLKDVIVPYTHLLPRLLTSENKKRNTLLYFKGAKHRHRGGLVREKIWDLLINEPGVIIEEGFPNATGKEQSIKGMRTSEFCLHPAGDTPTSCRLFDAIQSLCIPVIVSDNIELPFEGTVDYSQFSVFVAASDALGPNWLVSHLKSYTNKHKDRFRENMARVQPFFQYDNGYPGGIGPTPPDGAVNHIWKKVHQKLPVIREAITRERRKPQGVSVPHERMPNPSSSRRKQNKEKTNHKPNHKWTQIHNLPWQNHMIATKNTIMHQGKHKKKSQRKRRTEQIAPSQPILQRHARSASSPSAERPYPAERRHTVVQSAIGCTKAVCDRKENAASG